MAAKKTEKTILFFNAFFLSNLTLLSKILTLVVFILSVSRSLFVAVSDLNKVVSL